MVVKTNNNDFINEGWKSLARATYRGGLLAKLVHAMWHFNRKHFLIQELSKNLDDERFLQDVGLTRAEVEREIQKLRRRKPF
ncbi:hypothetical protein [Grimontia marina]|uniref:Uncharacterized protein n=1 Tax=Grimontia marina TaxID=646534 RepID=A0A128FBT2_9GAMM|nr:hypothetical protein [Grimontia marina]CZF84273.1 hypothetical protein GMA8713_03038 [Grimontia marina]